MLEDRCFQRRDLAGSREIGVARYPMQATETLDQAHLHGRDAPEAEPSHLEILRMLGKESQITHLERHRYLEHSRMTQDRGARTCLQRGPRGGDEEADAAVGLDVVRVLGQMADQYHGTPRMVGDVRQGRAIWKAGELRGMRGQHTTACSAEQLTRLSSSVASSRTHRASLSATCARRRPSARHSRCSSSESGRALSMPATWLAPYGVPPLAVAVSSGSVYGTPTRTMPWWSKGSIIDSRVLSWPPCCVAVEVNTAAGLPASVPLSHSPPLPSRKYLSGAAILPKRVGLPSARPAHSARSLSS